MARKISMQQLLLKKKKLMNSNVITQEVQAQMNQVDHQINQKINQGDQNFFRTFYRTAKEHLTANDFLKVENIASTRVHDYQKQHKSDGVTIDTHIPIKSDHV